MDRVRFRNADKEDQEFLWQALFFAVSVPPGTPPPKPEIVKLPELARYVDNWMRHPGDLGYIATFNGRCIGAAWIRIWSESDSGYGYVNSTIPEISISFLPEYRGKGIGTRLLELLLDKVSKKYEAVSLSVANYNPAKRLYERYGFQILGEIQNDSYTMIKWFGNANTSRTNQ